MGHGTLPAERFAELLRGAEVASLVDVRTAPGSRHNPQFRRAEMSDWLPAAGVAYRWEGELGGFRKALSDSPNPGLRHPAFRGYADYMRTPQFLEALDGVLAEAAGSRRTAVMCSESVWWRCHRRLVADAALLLREVPVLHLMHDGSLRPHQPTEGVRVEQGLLRYLSP